MSRWYSKKRKKQYSYELKTYNCIPNFINILLSAKDPTYGYEKLNYDGCYCDFCNNPRNGFYGITDDDVMCGKCIRKKHYSKRIDIYRESAIHSFSNFKIWKIKQSLNPNEFLCAWCLKCAEGVCDCAGAQYTFKEDPEMYDRVKSY